jgi:hypothetical protein
MASNCEGHKKDTASHRMLVALLGEWGFALDVSRRNSLSRVRPSEIPLNVSLNR